MRLASRTSHTLVDVYKRQPCRRPDRDTPFVALLNGQDLLPLNSSWAILLTNLIEALQHHSGEELSTGAWSAVIAQASAATRRIYRRTPAVQIESDLQVLLDCLFAVARGQTPPLQVQPLSLRQYAARMNAPPVSYTHLDVYKRQVHVLCLLWLHRTTQYYACQ